MGWFLLRNDSNDEEEINLSGMKKKDKSKQFVYSIRERIIKRHVKSFHKPTFEGPMIYLKFRVFLYGIMSRLDWQNKILTQLVAMQKSEHFYFSCAKYQY